VRKLHLYSDLILLDLRFPMTIHVLQTKAA
jgi:hypothetical protein